MKSSLDFLFFVHFIPEYGAMDLSTVRRASIQPSGLSIHPVSILSRVRALTSPLLSPVTRESFTARAILSEPRESIFLTRAFTS